MESISVLSCTGAHPLNSIGLNQHKLSLDLGSYTNGHCHINKGILASPGILEMHVLVPAFTSPFCGTYLCMFAGLLEEKHGISCSF